MADAGVDVVESGAVVMENMLSGPQEETAHEEPESQDFDPNDVDEEEPAAESEDEEEVEEEDPESEDEEEEEAEEEVAPKGGKAQKRIRALVAEKNELRQAQETAAKELEQFRYQQAYQQQQFEHQAALQKQAQEAQLQAMRQEMDILKAYREKEEEEDLDPREQIARQAAKRAEEAALKRMEERLEPFQKWQQEQMEAQKAQAKQAEQQKIHQEFARETEQARYEMLNGFQEKDVRGLSERLDEFILTQAAAGAMRPAQAKAITQKFLNDYADAREAARKAKRGAKIAKSQAAPKARGVARSGTVGKGVAKKPPLAALQKAFGINDYMEWREIGSPEVP